MSIPVPKVNGCTLLLMKKLTVAILLLGGNCLADTYVLGPDSQRQPVCHKAK